MISRLLPALLVVLLGACRQGSDLISRERFVAASAALRTLPPEAGEAERDAVLARYRVSADDLRRWVEANQRRPEALAAAWKEVAARVDSLAAAREAPPEEGLERVIDAPPPPEPDPFGPPPGAEKPGARRVEELLERIDPPRPPEPTGTRDADVLPPPRDRPGVDRTAPPVVIDPAPPPREP